MELFSEIILDVWQKILVSTENGNVVTTYDALKFHPLFLGDTSSWDKSILLFVQIVSFCLSLNKYQHIFFFNILSFWIETYSELENLQFWNIWEVLNFHGTKFSSKQHFRYKPKYSFISSEKGIPDKEFSYWCFSCVFINYLIRYPCLLKFLPLSFYPCLRIKQKRYLPTLFRKHIFFYHLNKIIASVLDMQNMQILSSSWSNNA